MKSFTNLYSTLCSYENLLLAFQTARKRKTSKQYMIEFEKDLKNNLLQLQTELLFHAYAPAPLKTFILRDPKTRKISVSEFRDRVVHHAIINVLEPVYNSRFIYDSYANRKGKGVHAALRRFDYFQWKLTKNGKCLDAHGWVCGYVLKADIKKYFDNVDHAVLLEILGRKIKDKQVTLLIRKVLGNHYVRKKGKGMPLGNLTSQFFANVYLDELDQFVKQVLRAKYYIRYVDDFIILHNSRKELERCETMIDEFLQKYLLLELHPDKCKIFPLYKGLNFLGFRLYYHFKLLRKRNLRKAFRRIELFKEAYQAELITKEEISGSMQGWYAYVKAANTYKLRMKTETYVTSFLNTD